MKRILYVSAIVLGFAMPLAGCPSSSDGPKDPSGEDSDDPVASLKAVSEGIQKDIDGLMEPINKAEAIIDDVAKLPAEIKASAGAKFDAKKLMAEANKIVAGQTPDVKSLGLEASAEAKVTERFDKLKELVTAVKTLDDKVKGIGEKIKDAIVKVPTLGAKATAKIEVTLKNPLAGDDAKKTAEENKKTISGIVDGFKDKASEWQKALTDLPGKAKDLPAKMSKAFAS